MDKTLEQKVQDAREEYMNFWQDVAKVTGDPQDMRLLIDCAERYYSLLKEFNEQKAFQEEVEKEL